MEGVGAGAVDQQLLATLHSQLKQSVHRVNTRGSSPSFWQARASSCTAASRHPCRAVASNSLQGGGRGKGKGRGSGQGRLLDSR